MLPGNVTNVTAFANLNNDLPVCRTHRLALKPDDDAEAMPSGNTGHGRY